MTKVNLLRQKLQALAKFGSATALLEWDREVYLPSKALAYRAEVNAVMAAELHKKVTDPRLWELVNELANGSTLNDDEKVIVREVKRDLERARKLPVDFVERLTKLTSEAFGKWVEARKVSKFKLFASWLEKIVEAKREEAALLSYKKSPYDALLDEFEPGMSTDIIDKLFEPLAKNLAVLITQAATQKMPSLPRRQYPLNDQIQLNREIAKQLGYDLEAGRIDVSPHPFTITFHTSDVRITTRYNVNDFWHSLGSTIHEVGHALYEQGLPEKDYGTPLGEAVSLGVHESQSRAWENFVGRSRAFSHCLYPQLRKHFGQLDFDEDDLYFWLNRVKPNLIRTESDEVTYNLHVVLRYELEKSLIEGDMKVDDLPAVWNQKMKDYLGLSVPSEADGVLQDVHWAHGSLGYFPTYTLGNLYAAQLFKAAESAITDLDNDFAEGHFERLLDWLRQNIHAQGRRYQPRELIERASGQPLDSKYLLEHLQAKVKLFV